jgi:RNA polymerase sigma-B factor
MLLPEAEVLDVRPGDQDAVDRVEEWFRQYAATGDADVRQRIIVAYLGLADRLAERFRGGSGASGDDLVQTARVGLVAAVDRYDPGRGNPFVPYAVACVVGELKRSLRDTSWRIHVARPVKERALRIQQALETLPQRLGRSPTIAEIAEHLEVGEEQVLEAIEVMNTRAQPSLDQPVGDDSATSVGDLVPAPEGDGEAEDRLLLPELLGRLPELEREVVVLRYYHELNQDEIAARIGYSQMHVSRLLRRALARMRAQLLPTTA